MPENVLNLVEFIKIAGIERIITRITVVQGLNFWQDKKQLQKMMETKLKWVPLKFQNFWN